MCGIAGIIAKHTDPKDLDLMLSMIEHRGPDEFGTYNDDDAALGTDRLSIIDLKDGQQPIRHDETGAVIAFNGEIFNYLELREDLVREGFRFRTHSDTEVILALYLKHGVAFPEQLNGQFAVSIWDPRDKKLVLARDRFGICPLFYHQGPGLFAFGSEIKSILTLPNAPRRVNLRAIDQIFTFWTTLPGHSAIEGIRELPPGNTLVYHHDHVTMHPYWDWPFPEQQDKLAMPFSEAVDGFLDRLARAVELRLRADVEVGSYLSGGIDSSAIVALATRYIPNGLRTYSVAFDDKSYDESKFQDMVARHYATRHTTVVCHESDIDARFERVIWHAETPVFRTAPTPLNILSERVRSDGIKVVLTGEGSDEVLLGYDIFREVKIRRFWRRQPHSTARPQLLKRLYAYLPQFANPRFANLAIESFGQSLMADSPFYSHMIRWANNSANKVYFSEEVSNALAGHDALADLTASLPEAYFAADDVDRAQYLELVTLLRGYLLSSQGDRMAMGNSVEGRFPYLDHEFVTFANRLPRSYKLAGLRDKRILRESMRKLLPAEICNRPKFAYQAPEIRAFMQREQGHGRLTRDYLGEEMTRGTGIFKPDAVRLLLRKIELSGLSRLGTRDNMAFVQMLSAHIFYRQFIETDIRELAKSRLRERPLLKRVDLKGSHDA